MHFCLGNINGSLKERSRLEDAVTNYRRALKINPGLAEAHYNVGNVLLALARSEEAAASYRRALTINPDFAEAHYNLGNALLELSQIDDAVASYLRALNINHFLIEAQINLGVVLARHGRIANTTFLKGVKFNPKVSETLVALAQLRISEGNFTEATELFRCAMLIEPESVSACAGLARTRKMTSQDDAWLAQAQNLIGNELPPQKKASLHYAVGKYYDDVGSFAQAFQNYRTANELIRRCGPKYERQHHTQAVDMLICACDRGWIERHRMTIQSSARPIFIVGMPRSGTSLAEQILASHPDIFGAGELFFWRSTAEMLDSSIANGEDCRADLRKIGCDYLAHLESLSPDALRTTDKMPGNFLFLGLIHAAFPKARIIHMQRNPLDTCLSLYFQNFGTDMPFRNDLEDLAHFYCSYVRIMKHWNTVLPKDTILHVPYEELIEDQQGWSRKMLDFVGMPWDERCVDFHRNVRPVMTASNWQVRQLIYKSSVERWRNYEPFITPLLKLLA